MVTDFIDTIPEDWVWNTSEPLEPEVLESSRTRRRRDIAFFLYCLFVLPFALILCLPVNPFDPPFAMQKRHRRGLRAPGEGHKLTARILAWRTREAFRVLTREGVAMVGRTSDGRVLACPLPKSWQERSDLPGRVVVYAHPMSDEVLGVRARGSIAARAECHSELASGGRLFLEVESDMPTWARNALYSAKALSPYRS